MDLHNELLTCSWYIPHIHTHARTHTYTHIVEVRQSWQFRSVLVCLLGWRVDVCGGGGGGGSVVHI